MGWSRMSGIGRIRALAGASQPSFIRRNGSVVAPSQSKLASDNGNGLKAGGAQRNPQFLRSRRGRTAGFASLHPPYGCSALVDRVYQEENANRLETVESLKESKLSH